MDKPLERIARLSPLAVLVDRSRDVTEWSVLASVEPYHAIRVTDHRRRLTRRVLAAHDMVVIHAHGTMPYSRAERSALVEFVERGGTLFLAASAGEFEASTGLPVSKLAVEAIARMFGFRFLTAAAYPRRHENYRHARRQDLELTAAGARIGLDRDGTRLLYPAPIEAPRGATALLREKGTGAPVFARARVGRGTVAVYGDGFIWSNGWSSFQAVLHLVALAPRGRTGVAPPRTSPEAPRESITEGRFTVRFAARERDNATRLLRVAKVVFEHLRRELRPPKVPDRIVLHVEPGGSMRGRSGSIKESHYVVGADLDDGAAVEALVRMLTFRLLMPWWGRHRAFPFVHAAHRHQKVRVMDRLGLRAAAQSWTEAMSGGEPVDLSKVYSQIVRTPPAMCRFFRDVEDRFGRGALRKMCRGMPRKKPFEGFPDLFSALDRFAFFLARALGREVYEWLEESGHTIRRLPLEEPRSEAFRAGVDRTLRGMLENRSEPISARLAAARALADRLKDEGRLLARARGRSPGRALPAALALARSRDDRAPDLLARWMRSRDEGIAAVAALHAVTEFGSRAAASRLVALADGADTAFRLAAGRALGAVGDARAHRFSFDALDGCAVRLWRNGHLRAYASVDGQDVAVVHVGPMFWSRGYGRTSSRCYVYWVHTHGPFRRLGIARRLLDAALAASPSAKACSEVALHSMTDYFAHALYVESGLIDSRSFLSLSKDVHPMTRRAPRGIRVRLATPADALAAADLARRTHEVRAQPDVRFTRFPGDDVACVAEEGGTLRGIVVYRDTGLHEFAVDASVEEAGRREAIAVALLAFAERRLASRGEKTVTATTRMRYDDPAHVRWLQRAGFSSKPDTLVEQSRITNLARFLVEIEGVLEARLASSKLPARRVTVGLDGGSPALRATLRIDGRRVRASTGLPAKAGVVLRGDAEAVQGVVFGVTSPFAAWNGGRLDILPTLGGETKRRLEALFPGLTE